MRVFVDSRIILAFLAGEGAEARRIVEEIEDGKARGYINPIVIDETMYGYLRLATGLSSRRIRSLLARRDRSLLDIIRADVLPTLELFTVLPLAAEPGEVAEIIEDYGLMPADALIALTCRKHGIDTIATLDWDFRRVPWLHVIPQAP